MSDFESNGALVRSTRGQATGRPNPYEWLKHPSERGRHHPIQPAFAIDDPRWAAELGMFRTMFDGATDNADRLKRARNALHWATGRGFCIRLADVPEEHRDTARAVVRSLGRQHGLEITDYPGEWT